MAGHGSAGAARRAAAAWEISDSDSEEPPGGGGSLRVPTPPRDPAPCPSRSRQRRTRSLGVGVGAAGLGREQQRADRARKKAQDALEKRQRREAAQALRPEQCLKYVAVCVHPGLLEDPGSDALIEALSSLECSYYIEPQAVPYSITWRRNIPHSLSSTDGPTMKSEEEKEVLVLVDPRDFLKRLFSVLQSLSSAPSDSRPDLSQVLPLDGPEDPPTKNCSLVVIGLDAYRWYNRGWDRQQALCSGEQDQQEDPRFQPGPELSMTQQEIEEVLVVLQLWANTMVSFLDTWQEFSQHVSALTKAIAKRPYKKQRDTELFSFCTDGKWSSGVRVEKDGTGLRQAWKRQIQQFNRVSPAAAAAIAEAYPSPSLLLQAYEECSTENDRLHLLSDIQVKPEDGGRERRIGPDISRRVYLFMVSTSPDLVLDLSA
ncbi:probable crossover junction endonuclease EME2 isoform X1 [Alligator mississippiensis]|uniref:probable crossover junction endonuclease EME2 isoform X1 n=1 Tax=Alligator mississippiensis TaxID=8496 RepID=UPI00071181B1|nr:probable crossover junction endonuclease EME2 isoform X1 [Alligator mississippiensis]